MVDLVQALVNLTQPLDIEIRVEGNSNRVAGVFDDEAIKAGLGFGEIGEGFGWENLTLWAVWMSLHASEVYEFKRERMHLIAIKEERL